MDEVIYPRNASAKQLTAFALRTAREGDCIVWTGAKASGYGVYNVRGQLFSLHRQVYIDAYGDVGDQQIDHLCRNRACFNLRHLEAVTQKENMHRGEGPAGKHARQTHCEWGHPLSGPNLRVYTDKQGFDHRLCRTCHRRRAHEQYQRKLAAKAAL